LKIRGAERGARVAETDHEQLLGFKKKEVRRETEPKKGKGSFAPPEKKKGRRTRARTFRKLKKTPAPTLQEGHKRRVDFL